MTEFQIGKLYMNAAGFIYEVIDKRGEALDLLCWNPTSPNMYNQVVTHFTYSALVGTLDEVDPDYLESVIRMQKSSIAYHMKEAQHKRGANSRFEKELRDGNR